MTPARLFLVVALAGFALAQKLDPIQWKADPAVAAGATRDVLVRVTASMEKGWHLYSLTTPIRRLRRPLR